MIRLLWIVALSGLLTSTGYSVLVLAALLRFWRRARLAKPSSFAPPVSVLKPLHGAELDLEAHLESFFLQDYPCYEILFCARHERDAGLAVARSVAGRHPHIPVQFLISGEPPWPNARCYSQELMRRAARYDILAISDSDVQVSSTYLRDVVAPFQDHGVGLVTCVYRGVAHDGLWARLEALGMSVEMTSGVLVAAMLEGMKFALGPTMVVRSRCMEELGGFEATAHYLADDFMLGSLIAERGHEVVLSTHPIEHHVLNSSFRSSISHQARWMQSTRFSRPKGHVGTVLTFAVPFGLLAAVSGALLGHAAWGLFLLGFTLLTRMLLAVLVGRFAVQDAAAVRGAWLYPMRDLMGFLLWVGSYTSRSISWRDDLFELREKGLMRRVDWASDAGVCANLPRTKRPETQAS